MPSEDGDLTLGQILWLAVRFRRAVLVGAFLGFAGGAGLHFAARGYIAQSQFVPETSGSSTSRLLGLAAQFGFGGAAQDRQASPEFYPRLLASRSFLVRIVRTPVPATALGEGEGPRRLADLLADGIPEAGRENAAVGRLRRSLAVALDVKSGTVKVAASAPTAPLAEFIVRTLIDSVSAFNISQRQSQASAERRFVEGRLADAAERLAESESRLQAFLERNRSVQNSPTLTVQLDALQRAVQGRQQIQSGLAEAFERARIDEVRNTPVVTVFDAPEGSARPSRSLRNDVIGGLLVGALFGFTLLLGLIAMRRLLLAGEPVTEAWRRRLDVMLDRLRG